MAAASFVLVPSPLVGGAVFEPLEQELREAGFKVSIVEGTIPSGPPFWQAFAGSVASQVGADSDVVLVGHSGAGLALNLVADLNPRIEAIVHMDGTLVQAGARWLDTFDAETLARPEFRESMNRGVMPNPWMGPELWQMVGVTDEAKVAQFAAGCRELPLGWYEEPLPSHSRRVSAAYLAFVPNPFYVPMIEKARDKGWPVVELSGQHFHFLLEPKKVARTLIDTASALLSGGQA
jgi:hypothetical protein